MKVTKEKTIISVTRNKILSEITVRNKKYKIMQKKGGAVDPTDHFEIGTMFDKSMIKLTTIPQRNADGEVILQFKPRVVFYVEMD